MVDVCEYAYKCKNANHKFSAWQQIAVTELTQDSALKCRFCEEHACLYEIIVLIIQICIINLCTLGRRAAVFLFLSAETKGYEGVMGHKDLLALNWGLHCSKTSIWCRDDTRQGVLILRFPLCGDWDAISGHPFWVFVWHHPPGGDPSYLSLVGWVLGAQVLQKQTEHSDKITEQDNMKRILRWNHNIGHYQHHPILLPPPPLHTLLQVHRASMIAQKRLNARQVILYFNGDTRLWRRVCVHISLVSQLSQLIQNYTEDSSVLEIKIWSQWQNLLAKIRFLPITQISPVLQHCTLTLEAYRPRWLFWWWKYHKNISPLISLHYWTFENLPFNIKQ